MQRKPSLTDLCRIIVENNRSGKTQADSVNMLRARGWPESAAQRFVHQTTQAHTDADANSAVTVDDEPIIVTAADASPLTMVLRITSLVGVSLMLLHMLSLLFP